MITLTQTQADVNANDEAPIDSEPTADYSEADAAWWAGQNTEGCHPDDRSPEDRLIDSAMSAMEYRLDQCGEEYRTLGLMEEGCLL